MRRASVRTSTLAVIAALLLVVGAGFGGGALVQDDSRGNGAFLDENAEPIAADQSIDGDGAAATAEPALVSPETLGAVAVAVAVALLIVVAVHRADR